MTYNGNSTNSNIAYGEISDVLTATKTSIEGSYTFGSLTEDVQYNYDETTGLFTTNPGQIVVPAATYSQDPVTGVYSVIPGIATLVVTGTI